jgi:hypothetical protein
MSYITIDSKTVVKCCEKYLKVLNQRKQERLISIVNKLANRRNWNFKKIGYDKAKEILWASNARMDYQIPFDVILFNTSEKEEIANRLLLLALGADKINVSDDACFIFEYLERN